MGPPLPSGPTQFRARAMMRAGAVIHVLRHNRGMPHCFPRRYPQRCLAAVLLLALTACERAPSQADAGGAAPDFAGNLQGDAAMEFRGRRPCVDCIGIDAWLRLEQRGGKQRYELVERYLAVDGERRFDDAGEWRAEDDLLRLRSDDGGERVYARMPDDSLLARADKGLDTVVIDTSAELSHIELTDEGEIAAK